ncbi:Fmu (Sun) domain protein [Pyrolobus fumarii 1A]|uniref:Fmu (Sun) domain protein n=1 Tax=Pyrolobus fumarii (strain DSM 11204 / 1A) TaxID=694429 RepID=G0EFX2_PYRF1|nr:RsmB/NOP family class I SAM-dependent RNA methyltransferase [Pyrolobus fumarii]AEM39073.1 Fmu (Sun) domain protein [Pyrolobus fumarii 1A]
MTGRVFVTRFDLEVLLEALVEAERLRPAQYARRRVFARRGVAGGKARFLAAILASIWRMAGLLDESLGAAGIDVSMLDERGRSEARLTAYLLLREERCARDERCVRLLEELGGVAARVVEAWRAGRLELDEELLEYLVPRWLLERVKSLLPGEWRELLRAFNSAPPVSLRVNTLKASYDRVWLILEEEGREPRRSRWAPEWGVIVGNPRDLHESRVIRHALAYPQDEASIVASLVLDPKPGELVFDLTAAPGGKTLHMAALMGNRGRIVAIDVSRLKARLLERNVERHGARIVEVRVMDAREAPRVYGESVADRVMLDAPCTSSGTLARNPDLRWRITPEEVYKMHRLQVELLEAAVRLAKPGARILYATCSIFPEEGEEVVKKILERRSDVEVVPLEAPFDPSPWLRGAMRAWPHRHGTIGFFYALLEKTRR